MVGRTNFAVTSRSMEVVAALLPMQDHRLPLSNLDLLLPPVDVSVLFCYKKPTVTSNAFSFAAMVGVLKKAMAQALVSYHELAGEVVLNDAGEPELLCNNRGVDFTEASADVELVHLNFYDPQQSVEGKLVAMKMHGVLAVQVTELKCGGVVVSCTFDHRTADAYSANMFLVSWTQMAWSKPLSQVPSFRRSLLLPRHPGHYDDSVSQTYVPISTLPPHPTDQQLSKGIGQQLKSRIYYVKVDQLNRLQALANGEHVSSGHKRRTKIEAFGAFLWKLLATATTATTKKRTCRLGIVVDGRTRISSGDKEKAKLMAAYFGNVLSIPFGEKKAEELLESSLSWAADEVHEFLQAAARKEHFLGLIDWMEAHRPEPALAKIYASGVSEESPAAVVSSGLGFPISEVDFGWGKPIFGSYYFQWTAEAGFVMPMPSPLGNGDWVVYMLLLQTHLEMIETQADQVFRPLASDYLKLI